MQRASLFRIKAQRYSSDLFSEHHEKSAVIIERAIREKPMLEVRKNHKWQVGNIENIDDRSILFAFGKILKSKREFYNDNTGDFATSEDIDAPYTYIMIDLTLQICAIIHKANVSQKASSIANNLAKVLTHTEIASKERAVIAVDSIDDPQEFIGKIKRAKSIKWFEISFGLPNPFDIEEDFHKPAENLLNHIKGNKGKASFSGEDLSKEVAENLSRSAVSSGDEAKARMLMPDDDDYKLYKSSGNSTTLLVESLVTDDEKFTFLDSMRTQYRKIRGTDE